MTPRLQTDVNLNELILRAVIDDLLLIWSTMEAEEWINLMWYLPL